MTAAGDALAALAAHLATITVANGYTVDIGAVSTGRAALAVGSQTTLPALTLTSVRDDPATGGTVEAGLWFQGWTRTVQLEALVAGADTWDLDLDAVLNDVRRALTRFPYPMTLGGITFTPPFDGGEIASAVMPLTFNYTVDYSE